MPLKTLAALIAAISLPILLLSGCAKAINLGNTLLGLDITSTSNIATFSATPSGQAVSISWTSTGNASVIMIRKSISDYPSTVSSDSLLATASASAHSGTLLDSSVSSDVKVYYSLFVSDSTGLFSTRIATASATPSTNPLPPISSAVTVSSFATAAVDQTVVLSFAPSRDVTQIMIRKSTEQNPSTTVDGTLVATASVTSTDNGSIIDASVLPRQTIYYSIFAADSLGRYSPTPATANVTLKTLPVTNPTLTHIDSARLSMSWTNPDPHPGDQIVVRDAFDGYPNSISEGRELYTGTANEFTESFGFEALAITANISIFVKPATGQISDPVYYSVYCPASHTYIFQTFAGSQSGDIQMLVTPENNPAYINRYTFVANPAHLPENDSDGTVIFSDTIPTTNVVTIKHSGFDIGTMYYVKLFLLDRNNRNVEMPGESDYFNMTAYPTLPSVTALSASATSQNITLNFDLPNTPIKKIEILRTKISDFQTVDVSPSLNAPVDTSLTSFTDTSNILPGTEYKYSVRLFGNYPSTSEIGYPSQSDISTLNITTLIH